MKQESTLITISNEDDAFQYLEQALNQQFEGQNVCIEFKNWPTLTIRIEGVGFDSTINAKAAEALVELQKALNRTYAKIVHHSSSATVLTVQEKNSIEFNAKVEQGSSVLKIELGDYAKELFNATLGKMTATQITVVLATFGIVVGGVSAHKSYLENKLEEKKVAERIAISAEETKRLNLVMKAINERPQLAAIKEDFDNVKHAIVRSGTGASRLSVQGITLNPEQIKAISQSSRSKSEEVQLNGNYTIDKIDWSKPNRARLSLSGTDQTMRFIAELSTETLTHEQKDLLKEAEWGRKHLYFSVNATVLRDEVTTAKIVGVAWPN